MKTLRIGDVFDLTAGMQAYVSIPEKYIYSNVRTKETLAETNIVVGQPTKGGAAMAFDTSVFVGQYVVEETNFGGGGIGMGKHDVYPDGHKITARKLTKSGKYDPKGRRVSFYQSGCFNAMNPIVPVVRTLKMSFA